MSSRGKNQRTRKPPRSASPQSAQEAQQRRVRRDDPNLLPEQELGVGMSLQAGNQVQDAEARMEARLRAIGEKSPALEVAMRALQEQEDQKDRDLREIADTTLVVRLSADDDPGHGDDIVDRLKRGEEAELDPEKAKRALREGIFRDNPQLRDAFRQAARGAKVTIKYLGHNDDGSVDVEVYVPPEEAHYEGPSSRVQGQIPTTPAWGMDQPDAINAFDPRGRLRTDVNLSGLQAAVARAEMKQMRDAVESDQELMRQLREHGTTVTWADIPDREPRSRTIPPDVWQHMTDTRYGPILPSHLGRADGLPDIRRLMLAHLEYEEHKGAAWRPLPIAPEDAWRMYFATKDFVDLFEQMHEDFDDERLEVYVQDIMENWGTSGQIVVGFDATKYPTVHWSGIYRDSTPEVEVPADPFVKDVEGGEGDFPLQVATVAAMTFQWATPSDGKTRVYIGYRSKGDSFRTSVWGSTSTREGILMAWMLANPALGFLESKPRPAGAGLPPKVKAKMRKRDRQAQVVVVSLRRRIRMEVTAVQKAQAGHREYHHRFIVRGHYKNQAYGTGRTLRRRIYVMPYVKGKDGLPWMARDKVYQW